MTPSNVFLNWTPATIVATPLTGSPVTIVLDGVLDVDPDIETQQELVYGDALQFARLILTTQKTRSLTITALDVAKCIAIPEDSTCVITLSLLDAKNGIATGGGGLGFTLSNAIKKSADLKAPNNKAAAGTVTFQAYGMAGDVDPLVIVAL